MAPNNITFSSLLWRKTAIIDQGDVNRYLSSDGQTQTYHAGSRFARVQRAHRCRTPRDGTSGLTFAIDHVDEHAQAAHAVAVEAEDQARQVGQVRVGVL